MQGTPFRTPPLKPFTSTSGGWAEPSAGQTAWFSGSTLSHRRFPPPIHPRYSRSHTSPSFCGERVAVMVSHRPVILPDAVHYPLQPEFMQHRTVLLISSTPSCGYVQPAGERDILRRYNATPAAVSRGTVQTASSWSAEVRRFRPETAEYLHFVAAIKRCDCAAGQSFNLNDLCRFTRKMHTI